MFSIDLHVCLYKTKLFIKFKLITEQLKLKVLDHFSGCSCFQVDNFSLKKFVHPAGLLVSKHLDVCLV